MLQNSPDRSRKSDLAMPFWPVWSTDLWQPTLGAMIAGAFNVGSAIAAINVEWLNFVNRRLKEDFAFAQRLGACTSPDDACRAYYEFLVKAAGDYQRETTEIARLGSRVAAEGTAVMQADAKAANPDTDYISRAA